MFQNNGMPTGYDQIQPGLDQPKQTPPGQPGRPRTALQGAIMGAGASQYPSDPSMTAWRRGQQQVARPLGAPHGDADTPGIAGAGASQQDYFSGAGGALSSMGQGQMQPGQLLGGGNTGPSQISQLPGGRQMPMPGGVSPLPGGRPMPQAQPGGAVGFIHNWQNEHPGGAAQGIHPLMQALQAAGYNASPYMYGQTESGNEISLDGEKFKLRGGENGPNPFWYQGGDDSGGGAQMRPHLHTTVGQQQTNPALLQAVMYGSQGQQPTNYLQQMLAMGSPTI